MGAVRAFLTPAQGPYNLAVFRIVLFGLMFVLAWDSGPRSFAALPEELFDPPAYSVFRVLPVSVVLVAIAQAVLLVGAALAAVGLWTRVAAPVAVAAGVYFWGVVEAYGRVGHSRHHLIWFGAVIAVSACADALSVDARRRGGGEPPPSRAYGVPLRLVWILLGLIYFVPGCWKVATQGLGWASPENMRSILRLQWFTKAPEWHPPVALDQYPVILVVLGLGVLVFELSALPLMLWRWGRRAFISAGVAFHAGTHLLMGIAFWPLVVTYVALVDWEKLRTRRGRAPRPGPVVARSSAPVLVVGVALVLAVSAAGVRHARNSWPIAAYPTFADRFAPVAQRIVVDLGAGPPVDLRRGFPWMDDAHYLGVMASTLRAAPRDQSRKLDAVWRDVHRRPPFVGSDQVTFVRQELRLADDGSGTVTRETRLHTIWVTTTR